MSRSEDNEKMLRDYFASWNARDAEKMCGFMADDCHYHDMGLQSTRDTKEEIKELFVMFWEASSDFNVEVKSLFATEDRACVEWEVSGTLTGDMPHFPKQDPPAKFKYPAVSVMELQGGKIKRNTDYMDMMYLLGQMGMMPQMDLKW